jgi:hypothetical protein
VNIGHAGADVLPELELVAALGDLDGPDLSGPVIDVLKEMPVDGAQMREIEIAGGDAVLDPLDDRASFVTIEGDGVGQTKLVLQNPVVGRIAVNGVAHSAATADCAFTASSRI